MRRRIFGLVAGVACLLCSVTAGAGVAGGREQVVAELKREMARVGVVDRGALDRLMGRQGWVALPVVAEGAGQAGALGGEAGGPGGPAGAGQADAPTPGAQLDAGYLSTWLAAYRHEDWPMLTIFGNFHWRSCHFANLHGSYDVLGLDWADTGLTLIDLGTSDGQRAWYRGENPFQRSAVFNARDPLKRSGLWPTCDGGTLDGSAFVVFDVANPDTDRILLFNGRYDHTYMVKTRKETWSAGLTWDATLKGNVSYTLEVAEEERAWSKGAYLSVRWE